ncbi:hypothetical protein CSV80_15985 [Sporosarcina sp. P12(2017)]|uniref:hypothetical protein n=1 Tax=unclassified Sporosarcina TaxID=2647733 RepID=UPI000C169B02|nr:MULTISPECIES: hypothetical protein [unclassified Sporosarcina]PIC58039.1 hypothetical protein CSV81_07140 [Sporosarcina sp. P10]PIC59426.1 hypothetical protein CSV80_15985 [Sporosarcina sp. P12(2017)]
METEVLYYKKFERKVLAIDYIEWAFTMLQNGISTHSLNMLASLTEPLNIFEVEEYFNRAWYELNITEPSYDESAKHYVRYLIRQIVDDQSIAIENANEVYTIVRDHLFDEEHDRWYEISEMIDDFLYGDNRENITRSSLNQVIVQVSKQHLKTK